MKKFGITALALLYAFLILSMSAERSNAWAIREAQSLAHPCGGSHSTALQSPQQSDTYISQKKLLEHAFVIELPREGVHFQDHSDRRILLSSFEYRDTLNGQPSSSRSPPFSA